MPSLEIQRWLARLYTDEEVLKQFLEDPVLFTRELSTEIAAFLQALDKTQLAHFASSLRSKRAREASEMAPMLLHVFGASYWSYFSSFARQALSMGPHKPAADAMAFCDFLAGCRELEDKFREAARYERLRLGLTMRLKRVDSRRFIAVPRRWPVIALKRFSWGLPCLAGPSDRLQRRATWALFSKLPLITGIWYW